MWTRRNEAGDYVPTCTVPQAQFAKHHISTCVPSPRWRVWGRRVRALSLRVPEWDWIKVGYDHKGQPRLLERTPVR